MTVTKTRCTARTAGCMRSVSPRKRGPLSLEHIFKLESIKKHEKSQGHKKCSSAAAAKTAAPNTSLAEKALCSLNRAQNEKMQKLFRTAHAIAKKAGHSQTLSGCVS